MKEWWSYVLSCLGQLNFVVYSAHFTRATCCLMQENKVMVFFQLHWILCQLDPMHWNGTITSIKSSKILYCMCAFKKRMAHLFGHKLHLNRLLLGSVLHLRHVSALGDHPSLYDSHLPIETNETSVLRTSVLLQLHFNHFCGFTSLSKTRMPLVSPTEQEYFCFKVIFLLI